MYIITVVPQLMDSRSIGVQGILPYSQVQPHSVCSRAQSPKPEMHGERCTKTRSSAEAGLGHSLSTDTGRSESLQPKALHG